MRGKTVAYRYIYIELTERPSEERTHRGIQSNECSWTTMSDPIREMEFNICYYFILFISKI